MEILIAIELLALIGLEIYKLNLKEEPKEVKEVSRREIRGDYGFRNPLGYDTNTKGQYLVTNRKSGERRTIDGRDNEN